MHSSRHNDTYLEYNPTLRKQGAIISSRPA